MKKFSLPISHFDLMIFYFLEVNLANRLVYTLIQSMLVAAEFTCSSKDMFLLYTARLHVVSSLNKDWAKLLTQGLGGDWAELHWIIWGRRHPWQGHRWMSLHLHTPPRSHTAAGSRTCSHLVARMHRVDLYTLLSHCWVDTADEEPAVPADDCWIRPKALALIHIGFVFPIEVGICINLGNVCCMLSKYFRAWCTSVHCTHGASHWSHVRSLPVSGSRK